MRSRRARSPAWRHGRVVRREQRPTHGVSRLASQGPSPAARLISSDTPSHQPRVAPHCAPRNVPSQASSPYLYVLAYAATTGQIWGGAVRSNGGTQRAALALTAPLLYDTHTVRVDARLSKCHGVCLLPQLKRHQIGAGAGRGGAMVPCDGGGTSHSGQRRPNALVSGDDLTNVRFVRVQW